MVSLERISFVSFSNDACSRGRSWALQRRRWGLLCEVVLDVSNKVCDQDQHALALRGVRQTTDAHALEHLAVRDYYNGVWPHVG